MDSRTLGLNKVVQNVLVQYDKAFELSKQDKRALLNMKQFFDDFKDKLEEIIKRLNRGIF